MDQSEISSKNLDTPPRSPRFERPYNRRAGDNRFCQSQYPWLLFFRTMYQPHARAQLCRSAFPSSPTPSKLHISRDQWAVRLPPATTTVSIQVNWRYVHHESTTKGNSPRYLNFSGVPVQSVTQNNSISITVEMCQGHTNLQKPRRSIQPIKLPSCIVAQCHWQSIRSPTKPISIGVFTTQPSDQRPSIWLSTWKINNFTTRFPCPWMAAGFGLWLPYRSSFHGFHEGLR